MDANSDGAYTPPYRGSLPCPVCEQQLSVRLARGRKSGKPFVMLVCPSDGRHIRGFINDQKFVASVLSRLEGRP
jgi:hypothetical protein